MIARLPSINLYLLAASILVSSAEPLDFLSLAYELLKRMNTLMNDVQTMSNAKSDYNGQLDLDCMHTFAQVCVRV
jgi:hypothetical protein